MCAPRRAAAVVRPRGREKSADRRRRILISRLLIIRASVPHRKSPFPAYFKGFPAVSPLIPPYPTFLKYPVSPQLQSSSAELRTQLETLQPDISALKNVRKYIDMVLNKQQLSAPGGKTPEKESVLKKLEQLQQKKSNYKTISTTPNREESL